MVRCGNIDIVSIHQFIHNDRVFIKEFSIFNIKGFSYKEIIFILRKGIILDLFFGERTDLWHINNFIPGFTQIGREFSNGFLCNVFNAFKFNVIFFSHHSKLNFKFWVSFISYLHNSIISNLALFKFNQSKDSNVILSSFRGPNSEQKNFKGIVVLTHFSFNHWFNFGVQKIFNSSIHDRGISKILLSNTLL